MTTQHGGISSQQPAAPVVNPVATPGRGDSENGPIKPQAAPVASSIDPRGADATSRKPDGKEGILAGRPAGANQEQAAPQVAPEKGANPLMGVNHSNSARSSNQRNGVAQQRSKLFALTPEQRDSIEQLEALQSAKRRVLQSIETLQRGTYYQDRRARLLEQIQFFTCQLAQLDSEYENADDITEQTQREIDVINERLKLLRHSAAIAKIVELTRKVNGVTE